MLFQQISMAIIYAEEESILFPEPTSSPFVFNRPLPVCVYYKKDFTCISKRISILREKQVADMLKGTHYFN